MEHFHLARLGVSDGNRCKLRGRGHLPNFVVVPDEVGHRDKAMFWAALDKRLMLYEKKRVAKQIPARSLVLCLQTAAYTIWARALAPNTTATTAAQTIVAFQPHGIYGICINTLAALIAHVHLF